MDSFAVSLAARISQAREAVRSAHEAGDEYAEEVNRADLANLERLAAQHGVDVDTAAEPPQEG